MFDGGSTIIDVCGTVVVRSPDVQDATTHQRWGLLNEMRFGTQAYYTDCKRSSKT